MAEIAVHPGPVVRMCEDPACNGVGDCPAAAADRARVSGRTLAVWAQIGNGLGDPDAACLALAQDIASSARVPDSSGVYRMVPDGTEFRVHKGAPGDTRAFAALYSGPEDGIDGIMAGGMPWPTPDYEDAGVRAEVERRMAHLRLSAREERGRHA